MSEHKKTLKGIIKEVKGKDSNKKEIKVKIRTKGNNEQLIEMKGEKDNCKSGEIEFEYNAEKDGKFPEDN